MSANLASKFWQALEPEAFSERIIMHLFLGNLAFRSLADYWGRQKSYSRWLSAPRQPAILLCLRHFDFVNNSQIPMPGKDLPPVCGGIDQVQSQAGGPSAEHGVIRSRRRFGWLSRSMKDILSWNYQWLTAWNRAGTSCLFDIGFLYFAKILSNRQI